MRLFFAVVVISFVFPLYASILQRIAKRISRRAIPISINSIESFNQYSGTIPNMFTTANTSCIVSSHPVIQAVVDRYTERSTPGNRRLGDNKKIALCIEGGGMRGCVAAGSTAALQFLGLTDAIDCVYGSSAGSMIAAYFVSRQSAGVGIYHDILPAAGNEFIDKTQLLPAVGISPPHLPGITKRPSVSKTNTPPSQPRRKTRAVAEATVFNLDFLLDEVMAHAQPLDFPAFVHNDATQRLHVVTSSLRSLEAISFSSIGGLQAGIDYTTASLSALLACIRASMNVPGITGRLLGVTSEQFLPFAIPVESSLANGTTALADAFLTEPIPYRSAVDDGASHLIVLRTRPDPSPILGRGPGLFEKVICRRFFHTYGYREAADWVRQQRHQHIYAHDLVCLNDAARGPDEGIPVGGRMVHLLPVAPRMGQPEVGQLENKRAKVLAGMRDGCRRTLELFAPSVYHAASQGGKCVSTDLPPALIDEMVQMIFPDSILDRTTTLEEYRQTQTLQSGQLTGFAA